MPKQKQLTAAEIHDLTKTLSLPNKIELLNDLKADIEAAKKHAQETIELINGSVK